MDTPPEGEKVRREACLFYSASVSREIGHKAWKRTAMPAPSNSDG
jgi:hypothetical protein